MVCISAKREVLIDLGEPYGNVTIERSMTSLKYYHDFNCEVEHLSYAFGPCWEPVMSQCNLGKPLLQICDGLMRQDWRASPKIPESDTLLKSDLCI